MRLRVGDTVQVMSGADRGKQGKVLRLFEDGRVLVEGVNVRWKHAKPSQKQPRGGRIRKEAAVHGSKVMPLDPESGRPTRVGHAVVDGKKVRTARRSGKPIPFPERG